MEILRRFFLTTSLFFLSLFPLPALAEMECGADAFCHCQKTWSHGFDLATEYMITEVVSVYLSQNHVAPADMWSGRRGISLQYRCLLEAVCRGVEAKGDSDLLSSNMVTETLLGGSFPGTNAACPSGVSVTDFLKKIAPEQEIAQEMALQCALPKTNIDGRFLIDMCQAHADVSGAIFDRMLTNMIWNDIQRKVSGGIFQKILKISRDIEELQHTANSFVTNANGAFGVMCTLSNAK